MKRIVLDIRDPKAVERLMAHLGPTNRFLISDDSPLLSRKWIAVGLRSRGGSVIKWYFDPVPESPEFLAAEMCYGKSDEELSKMLEYLITTIPSVKKIVNIPLVRIGTLRDSLEELDERVEKAGGRKNEFVLHHADGWASIHRWDKPLCVPFVVWEFVHPLIPNVTRRLPIRSWEDLQQLLPPTTEVFVHPEK